MSGLKSQLRLRVLLPTAVLALGGVGVSAFAFGGTPPVEGADPLPAQVAGGATTNAAAQPKAKLSEWSKGANALCIATLERVEALDEAHTPEALQARLAQSLELESQLATRLAALPRPKASARKIERLLGFASRSRDALARAVATGTGSASVDAFGDAMDESHAQGERFDALARRLGAAECAKDGTKARTPLEKALLREKIVVVALHAGDATVDRLTIREARAGASAAKVGYLAIDVGGAKDLETIRKAYDVR
ncbi:MAG: hypothetical protein KY396_03980, partial [Actinobacteria bacterium]|nr:hypothetical protein [Actinomycetota bacterium]